MPTALTSAVAKVGIAGLSEQQRAYLPSQIEPADEEYKNRLRDAFEGHPGLKLDAFNHFVEAQLVWDEGMAESAAAYLEANTGRRMVILAGAGHVEYGSGIPKRLERRMKVTYAIVLNSGEDVEPHIADYFLLSQKQELQRRRRPRGHLERNEWRMPYRFIEPWWRRGQSETEEGRRFGRD